MKSTIIRTLLATATLSLCINASATTTKNFHIVRLKVSNGMTGAQACQQQWSDYATCIPTQNTSSQTLTLSSPTVSGSAKLSPGDIVAIVNSYYKQNQLTATVVNQNGTIILNNQPEFNDQGDTCTGTSCQAWK